MNPSLRGAAWAYCTAWACVAIAGSGDGEPQVAVLIVGALAGVAVLTVDGRGARSAVALVMIGMACGWLYIAPALGAWLHEETFRLEQSRAAREGLAYGAAVADSTARQLFAGWVGAVVTPLMFAAVAMLGPKRPSPRVPMRLSRCVPLYALLCTLVFAPAVAVAFGQLAASSWQMHSRGGDGMLALATCVGVMVTEVVAIVGAAGWAWTARRPGAEPRSFWLTVLAGPLLSLLFWGFLLVTGLQQINTIGAIVPLGGSGPPKLDDPVILQTLARTFGAFLLLGPFAFANLWFMADAARFALSWWQRLRATGKEQ